mmetsp:Transcript_5095/g.13929  ORF Transcript_5095/g.13929 Transcript_5095/m.13929 type:complete len:209 (+) Transcript_5095:1799-2425(+)
MHSKNPTHPSPLSRLLCRAVPSRAPRPPHHADLLGWWMGKGYTDGRLAGLPAMLSSIIGGSLLPRLSSLDTAAAAAVVVTGSRPAAGVVSSCFGSVSSGGNLNSIVSLGRGVALGAASCLGCGGGAGVVVVVVSAGSCFIAGGLVSFFSGGGGPGAPLSPPSSFFFFCCCVIFAFAVSFSLSSFSASFGFSLSALSFSALSFSLISLI